MAKKKATTKARSTKKKAAGSTKKTPRNKKKRVSKESASASKASKRGRSTKKTARSGRAGYGGWFSGGGDSDAEPLCDQLRDEIIGSLKDWQGQFGRSGIRELMMQLMNPATSHTQFLEWMIARGQTYHAIIKAARDNGQTYPFIIPAVAAAAFESQFQACAAFWLAAGEPPAPDQLRQSVLDFIDFQVGLFCVTVGAS